jgi:isopentenyl-diphosphate delta-isomerase
MNIQDYVVLIDDNNQILGTAPKAKTHNANTPLHRGLSVFLFDYKKNLLLQQRSKLKKTFPLVWSNSCCGHPKLNETNVDAAKRHLKHELGIGSVDVFEIIPNYRYKVGMDNIFENEICPILVCFTNQKPTVNKDEVEAIRWIPWGDFLKELENGAKGYSLWSMEEAILLESNKKFLELFEKYTQ